MKKLILGLVIGLMLGMSTNAFAAIGDTVQATFASFNYIVNGESKTMGAPVLVYEGTSYVRTTQISNLLGYDVTYKSDSRTIAFNGGAQTPILTPVTTSIGTVTDATYGATPTPEPSGTPNPNATPSPTPTPSGEPTATPVPTLEPSPSQTPSPITTPSNTGQCQSIRDSYGYQIAMVGYEGGAEGPKRLKILGLQNQMASALSSAGCN